MPRGIRCVATAAVLEWKLHLVHNLLIMLMGWISFCMHFVLDSCFTFPSRRSAFRSYVHTFVLQNHIDRVRAYLLIAVQIISSVLNVFGRDLQLNCFILNCLCPPLSMDKCHLSMSIHPAFAHVHVHPLFFLVRPS